MYDKLGYYVVEPGQLLVRYCEDLVSRRGWEKDLASFLRPIHGSRPLNTIRAEDIHALPGVGMFADGTAEQRQIVWLLLVFLSQCGEDASEVPSVVGYRATPTLTIDEVVMRVIGNRAYMPNPGELSLDAQVRWAGIPSLLATVFRRIAAVGRDRIRVRNAIRVQLADIGYRAARGLPLSPHERSLLLCYGDYHWDEGPGRTAEEMVSGITQPLTIAPHDSAIVSEIWNEVQGVTLCGPYSRFFRAVSNTNKEELIYSLAPHVDKLRYLRGYRIGKGWFDTYEFDGSVEFDWDRSAQLVAAREAGVAYNHEDRPFTGVPPMRVGTLATQLLDLTYDEPEVRIELHQESGVLKLAEFIWHDKWLERRVTSHNGATPHSYLYSTLITQAEYGNGEIGDADVGNITTIDELASAQYLQGAPLHRGLKRSVKYYRPARATETATYRGLIEQELDMTTMMKGHGEIEFLPAFTEYVRLPRSILFKERPEEEALAQLQQGMSREEVLQAELAIRITLNYYLTTQALGESAVAISEEAVLDIASALSTSKREQEV